MSEPGSPRPAPAEPGGSGGAERWSWTPAVLVALGAISVALLVAVHGTSERHVVHYGPVDAAAADLRVAVALSHLWLEEHLTGDPVVDPRRDVWGELERAEAIAAALLDGGRAAEERGLPGPLDEPELRARLGRIRARLAAFRELTATRLSGPAAAGVGSPLDQRYDAAFRELLGEMHGFADDVEARMRAGQRRSRRLVGGILAAWLTVVALAVAAVVERGRRRREALEALRRSEARLHQAQKLEAVGQLAGGLAHDVNNYLATINAQAGLVKLTYPREPRLAGLMDEILATVARTTSLIERLLAFGRSRPASPRPVDLGRLADGLGGMMGRLLGDDVRLEVRPAPGLWSVEADPSQLEQVLVNLLVNARDAMPAGGRAVVEAANAPLGPDAARRAGSPPGAEGRDFVRLTVRDEGEGISPELRERVFEPFFSTRRGEGHSGLGLATVYAIVRDAGGFVDLEGEPGEGTAFHVYLPRSAWAEHAAVVSAPPAAARAVAPGRVLVVEDNEDLRRGCRAILAAVGHRVETAADGEEGVRRIAEADEPFDAVVTDLVMPRRSGLEVGREALAAGAGVVVVSGYRDRIDVDELLAVERVRFLAKPYTADALLAAVAEVLAPAAAGARARSGSG